MIKHQSKSSKIPIPVIVILLFLSLKAIYKDTKIYMSAIINFIIYHHQKGLKVTTSGNTAHRVFQLDQALTTTPSHPVRWAVR
jgi:hypothetical protein